MSPRQMRRLLSRANKDFPKGWDGSPFLPWRQTTHSSTSTDGTIMIPKEKAWQAHVDEELRIYKVWTVEWCIPGRRLLP